MAKPDGIRAGEITLNAGAAWALVIPHSSAGEAASRDGREGVRATARTVLSHVTGLSPEALCVERTAQGKPYLAGVGAVSFNLSHARGYSLLALSGRGALGCDIENRFQADDAQRMAPLVLHTAELALLAGLPDSARHEAFMRLWVRKESVLKAMGTGFGADPKLILAGLAESPAAHVACPGPLLYLHDGPVIEGCRAAVASENAACVWRMLTS